MKIPNVNSVMLCAYDSKQKFPQSARVVPIQNTKNSRPLIAVLLCCTLCTRIGVLLSGGGVSAHIKYRFCEHVGYKNSLIVGGI